MGINSVGTCLPRTKDAKLIQMWRNRVPNVVSQARSDKSHNLRVVFKFCCKLQYFSSSWIPASDSSATQSEVIAFVSNNASAQHSLCIIDRRTFVLSEIPRRKRRLLIMYSVWPVYWNHSKRYTRESGENLHLQRHCRLSLSRKLRPLSGKYWLMCENVILTRIPIRNGLVEHSSLSISTPCVCDWVKWTICLAAAISVWARGR